MEYFAGVTVTMAFVCLYAAVKGLPFVGLPLAVLGFWAGNFVYQVVRLAVRK